MLLVKLIIKKTVKIRMNLKELKERAKNLCNLDYWLFVLVYLVFSIPSILAPNTITENVLEYFSSPTT